jgi:hypothetical protein
MSRGTRGWMVPAAILVAVGLSGCQNDVVDLGDGDAAPATLIVSEAWVSSQGADGSGGEEVRARIAALQDSIDQLREETGTGWIGRQDDVTGYLAELSGGSRQGDGATMMDTYGPELFGVDSGALSLEDTDSVSVPNVTTTRATQVLRGVPVLDGALVFTGRLGGAGTDDDQTTGVRGRVFPGLTVSTEPRITGKRARQIAADRSGGIAQGQPRLVVVPNGAGVLAWEVAVVSDAAPGQSTDVQSGNYYIDARTGDLLMTRITSVADAPLPGASAVHAEPDPNSVEVRGPDAGGTTRELQGFGVRTSAGVELVDTTTPSWDGAARRGAVMTYDASSAASDSDLPGKLFVSPDTQVRDPDAIAAHAYARAVVDFYGELGRRSWDNQGGTLHSAVHFGGSTYCNASFKTGLRVPMMVYGDACVVNGTRYSTDGVYPDRAGHEITHGVTNTSAGLIYTGQSGALNESFSDYLGNVIGNRVSGVDTAQYGEDACVGITSANPVCSANPDGSLSVRYLLNGNDFDDYARLLDPGLRLLILGTDDQDYGGVHINSAIWNNALWSIRTQLAKIDNTSGNESVLARAFDKVVYGALVTRLSPGSGFVDARAAVEQVIIDSQLDPVVLRVAREVFDANKICTGCSTVGTPAGEGLGTSPSSEIKPTVSGDLVTWLDARSGRFVGSPMTTRVGTQTTTPGPDGTYEATLAGESLVTMDGRSQITRYGPGGAGTVLARGGDDLIARGLVGSDAGAAWALRTDSLSFVDPAGTVTETAVPALAGDTVISVGTGGGTVAAGTDAGKVLLWQPGGEVTQVGRVPGAVVSVSSYGRNVLAVGCAISEYETPPCTVKLFKEDGQTFTLSSKGAVFGAAMSEDYAVWPEITGDLEAGVLGDQAGLWPDTDLYVMSLKSGQVYSPFSSPGQQGFPSISGRRVVWQDASQGGDDITTGVVPEGL